MDLFYYLSHKTQIYIIIAENIFHLSFNFRRV